MKKIRRVEVRFSVGEFEKLAKIADRSDQTLSDVVRYAAIRTKTVTLGSKNVQLARIRELARIGNNLNQIAKWSNTHKSNADALKVIAHLQALKESVVRLLDAN